MVVLMPRVHKVKAQTWEKGKENPIFATVQLEEGCGKRRSANKNLRIEEIVQRDRTVKSDVGAAIQSVPQAWAAISALQSSACGSCEAIVQSLCWLCSSGCPERAKGSLTCLEESGDKRLKTPKHNHNQPSPISETPREYSICFVEVGMLAHQGRRR
ncbi:uncharacterized protein MEPE_03243 [Melanopsichium pennsylvanicum]|uniref:Uncharacterized protein n=1 Tax=Melanopsichium pennsylvanicum TaxID=63383 RepID=A0AAJ4XKN0_9BASI|nr:uncharacterized protein MEPE_03243 [Melanopsichium pennsylvanicum]